jgi:sec-independent protein translocase protein TatC
MKTYRKHSYVVMILLSAVITPPDVFSQIMVCIPLVILYEIGIMISRSVTRQREKELEDL